MFSVTGRETICLFVDVRIEPPFVLHMQMVLFAMDSFSAATHLVFLQDSLVSTNL